MADQFDKASDLEQLDRDRNIEIARRKMASPEPTGFCITENCGEAVGEGRRWCNSDCRDMWEQDQRRLKNRVL